MASRNSVTAAGNAAALRLDDTGFKSKLASAAGTMRAFGNSIRNVAANVSRIGLATGGIGVAGGFALSRVVSSYAEYDQILRNIQASAGFTDGALAKLGATLRKVNRETPFNIGEVGSVMLQQARAGFDVGQIEAFTNIAAKMAVATGEDVTVATQVGIAALKVFGRTTEETADILVKATNSSRTTLGELGTALAYVAPIGKQLGFTMEEVAAALGVLADAGVEGSMQGTGLRRLFQGLTGAGEAADMLRDLGVATVDPDTGKLRRLGDILNDIFTSVRRASGGNQAQFVATMAKLFDIRGGTAALNLTELDRFIDKLDTLEKSGGSLEVAFSKAASGLQLLMKTVSSAFSELKVSLGQGLDAELRNLAKTLQSMFASISSFVAANPKIIKGVAGGVTGLLAVSGAMLAAAPVITALGMGVTALSAVVGPLVPALMSLGSVAIANPAAAAIAALAGVAGLSMIPAILADLGAAIMRLPGAIIEAGNRIYERIGPTLEKLGEIMQTTKTAVENFSAVGLNVEMGRALTIGLQRAFLELRPLLKQIFSEISIAFAEVFGTKNTTDQLRTLLFGPGAKIVKQRIEPAGFPFEGQFNIVDQNLNGREFRKINPRTGSEQFDLTELVTNLEGFSLDDKEILFVLKQQLALAAQSLKEESEARRRLGEAEDSLNELINQSNQIRGMQASPAIEDILTATSPQLGSSIQGTFAARGGFRGTVEKPLNEILTESKKTNEELKMLNENIRTPFLFR